MALMVSFSAFADTWTVAGSSQVLGSSWSPSDSSNDMVTSDDVNYTLEKTGCKLEEGVTYEFKICKDHNWTIAYPGSNKQFTVPANGEYTVTFTFNSSKQEVGEPTCVKTKEWAPGDKEWTVAGSSDLFGTNWNPTDANNDMIKQTDGTFKLEKTNVQLSQGNIEYKIVANHGWDESYPSSNAILNIPVTGAYDVVITFDPGTKEVNATALHSITATKFTVVGENGTLFDGYVWNTEPKIGEEYNPINDMTLVNGVWTITKTDKLLPAGNIQWKVVFDNDWDPYYGGIKGGNGEDKDDPGTNNAVVNIPVVGTYTVTFTFDPVTRKVASVATKTADYEITSWCVGGNSGAGNVLGGGDWGLYDTNLMTAQNDGKTWTLVKTPVTFTKAGTFEFKAFANKENIVSYPGSNASMTITAEEAAAGNYTVTFTLDTEAKTLVAEKELILNTYTATFVNTGNWNNVYAFAWTDGTTADPAWPGKELTEKAAEQVDGHDVYTFSISLPGVAPENIIFNNGLNGDAQTPDFAFVDGKQYSYFTTITVPAITALGYSTYSSEYPLDFTSVTAFKAYIATVLDADDQVIMAPVTGRVPARTGLLLAAAGGCDATEVPVATGHVDAPANNLLVAHVEAGDVEASNPDNNEYRYVLANRVSTGTGFYRLATTLTLPANRAYLQTTTPLATAGTDAKVAWIFTDDGTTNINTLDSRLSTLDSSQPMYNLAGQKVSDSYKGIVIVNGRKYVVK